ncbi:hypothetical protein ES319_D09G074700v1 [Gossypium barbadense]|uniref:Uncharacterized protein n=1 Tax=Gossypium barbadense TaxID=3634 RepID=A0A5J5Q5B2_GOSBA|nr:hypothetical protein ES319_D09G074700v1 [Gossypium barbadense]
MADFKHAEDDHEGKATAKKYGGLVPKKPPLISKQGAGVNKISTLAIETLRPKLKRTPHPQLPPRRPACTSGGDNTVP